MIALVDIVGANSRSLRSCLERIKAPFRVVYKPEDFKGTSHVILAGVGAAASAMQAIETHQLKDVITALRIPVLGICSGMHILFDRSEEGGLVDGLGIIPGTIKKIHPHDNHPVPHSGWNQLKEHHPSALSGLNDEYVYFVHSYAASQMKDTHILMSVDYSISIPALVQKDNYFGAQFHPEKSSQAGEIMLKEFYTL
ncbi:MAG: imidazole glycerol phosphate synthase subunit HisH [Proteobacteria bacterium]|nr:imidazole glycerol phosphate synthase subunit HisH [Pseudomonadota bacterium]